MQHILNQHSHAESEYSVEDLSSDGDENDVPVFDSKKKATSRYRFLQENFLFERCFFFLEEPRFLLKTKVAKTANVLYPLAYHWSSQLYNIPKV